MCERSGVVNIGIEGTMLSAAFVGWIGRRRPGRRSSAPSPAASSAPRPTLAGRARRCAVLSGVVVSLLHAWLSISVKADQIISGTIINIAAFGITGYLNTLLSRELADGRRPVHRPGTPPTALTDLPVVGWLFDTFLDQGPITIVAARHRHRLPDRCCSGRAGACARRAVGEHPKAAETVGIDVIRLRYRNVLLGGVLAGLGGAYLSMEATASFQAGHDRRHAGSSAWPR